MDSRSMASTLPASRSERDDPPAGMPTREPPHRGRRLSHAPIGDETQRARTVRLPALPYSRSGAALWGRRRRVGESAASERSRASRGSCAGRGPDCRDRSKRAASMTAVGAPETGARSPKQHSANGCRRRRQTRSLARDQAAAGGVDTAQVPSRLPLTIRQGAV